MHKIPSGTSRLGAWCLVVALGATQATAAPLDDEVAAALLEHTNRLRVMSGVDAMSVEPRLTAAARRFAEFMANSDRYGHEADGRHPAQRAQTQGYVHCLIAENIAFAADDLGFEAGDLAAVVFDGWVTSPSHRRNILDGELTEIGIATAYSAHSGRHYAVQLLGRPRSLAMRFDIINTTDSPVTYQLASRTYQLPAGVMRSHQQCRQASLSLQGATLTIPAVSGAHYRIDRSNEGLRLQRE